MTPLAMILIVALVVVVLAFGAYVVWKEWRTRNLRSRFGPEYSRTVKQTGSRRKAESRLKAREHRVEKFHIRPLSREKKIRYLATWQSVQAEFVDDPRQAVRRADSLLGDVMAARGYPVSDFEQRSADLSNAEFVENFVSVAKIRLAQSNPAAEMGKVLARMLDRIRVLVEREDIGAGF